MYTPQLLTILAALSFVSADDISKDEYCVDAVYSAYSELPFEGNSPEDYWPSVCQNPLKVGSVYAAATKYCTPTEIIKGVALLDHYCVKYGETTLLPISDFEANLTQEYISSLRVIEAKEIPETGPNITEVVMLSDRFFALSLRTETTWYSEMAMHHHYGFASYGFWGAVLVIGMIVNASHHISAFRMSRQHSDVEQSLSTSTKGGNSWNLVKQHLILPTVLGPYRRRLWFGFAIPTRIEAFVIAAFWACSIVLTASNINTFMGNLYWDTIPAQVWRYIADRTGIMAYANLPILWMFSGRNNIFLWATGWDYSTFNLFHRHIARVATVQAIIHSIAYTVIYGGEGYYKEELKEPWFYLGIMATVAFGSLLIFSSVWLRKKSYEMFLLIHIVLSVIVIVCLFYHTSIFEGEYNPYLWPLVAIWSFDRFLRLVKLALCNIRLSLSKNVVQLSTSITTYNEDADIVKVVIKTPNKIVKPKPGQYYYLYRPLSYKGWENHPFTLGSYKRRTKETNNSIPPSPVNEKEIMVSSPTDTTSSMSISSNNGSVAAMTPGHELTFWIRPFSGWTSRLRTKCRKSGDNTLNQRLLIEGPYGRTADLHNYESVLFIAGGTGISAALPYMEEHVHRLANVQANRTHSIELVWTSRNQEFIHDVCADEMRSMLTREDMRYQFFSTSEIHTKSRKAEVDHVDAKMDITVNQGRPDIPAIIMNSARSQIEGGAKAGRLAILVCGPASMADTARLAVIEARKQGCREIEYIEETFGW